MMQATDSAMSVFAELLNLQQDHLFQLMSDLQLSPQEYDVLRTLEQRAGGCRSILEPVFVAHLHDSHMVSNALPEHMLDQIRVQQQQLYGQLLEQGHLQNYQQDSDRLLLAHQQMGLHKDWYFSAFRKYLAAMWRVQQDDGVLQTQLPVWVSLMFRLAMLDLGVALHFYAGISQQRLFDALVTDDSFPEASSAPDETLAAAGVQVRRVLQQWQNVQQADTPSPYTLMHLKLIQFPFLAQTHPPEILQHILAVLICRIRRSLSMQDLVTQTEPGEILILLRQQCSYVQLLNWYQSLAAALREPLILLGESLQFSVTAGVAMYPDDGQQAESLWQQAQLICVQNQAAAGLYFCNRDRQQQLQQEQTLIRDLRRTLQQLQLSPVFVPRYSLPHGQLAGYCVSLRWQHPELEESLSESCLWQLAQNHGLSGELCRYLMHRSFACMQQWHAAQLPFRRLVLPLPDVCLRDPRFAGDVLAIAAQYQIRYSDLVLQTGETAFAGYPEGLTMMQQLTQLGFGWELGGFGSGISSLNALNHWPLHSVQLSAALCAEFPPAAGLLAMCRAVLIMAHGSAKTVCAVVPDHAQHWQYLCALGVDLVQSSDAALHLSVPQVARQLQEMNTARDSEVWHHRPAWQFL
ncbi:EAL domain-containing protein [Undibacterium squillarum]|uniref:EAL domain-containing protein n=1 Tax=Undibacterium squillarum TaxID=1131567 RepID=A0ABQ2XY90_9BURK|nr:EAL domain-containing protein [Undibacterium squillarum]GGX41008.1 hypothetical protein GCM10010946_19280 [Undibacterium squillarum]